ncbi:MAG: cytochrome c [Myxococcaceae bacterium]
MQAKLVSVFLMAMLVLGSEVSAAPPQGANSERKLEPPAYLSEVARGLLRKRMIRHARDMSDLFVSVTLLLHHTVADLATRIATEPRITRPTPGAIDELNRSLPPKFFDLQDQLQSRARALAVAAAASDDAAMAAGFGRLIETCVACHATYLRRDVSP